MKKSNIMAVAFLIVMMFVAPRSSHVQNSPLRLSPIVVRQPKFPLMSHPINKGGLRAFLRVMAKTESDNNQYAVNRFGFLGKYQFHPLTIRALGIETTEEEFLQDNRLQDSAMIRYMRDNAQELHGVIIKYSGKIVHGVYITKSGILAGAHLAGTNGVLAFFRHENLHDANGTTVGMYMKKFGGYDLHL